MQFDLENRRVWSQDRRGHRTFYVYDLAGRQRFTIQPDANDGIGASAPTSPSDSRVSDNPRTETVYDLVGRVTDTYDELRRRTQINYFADGTPDAGRRRQTVAVRSAGNLVTEYQYDRAGNVRFVTDPRGYTTETRYDEQGRPCVLVYPATDEHPATQSETTYDAIGRRVQVSDQEGKITRYRFDGLGHLTEVRHYLEASTAAADFNFQVSILDPRLLSTRYTYDSVGNQQTQADALGRVTTYWTDKLGRRTRRILPKNEDELASLTETLQYDEWGNLWKRTDFAGRITTFGYDILDRLQLKVADLGHPSLIYSHAIARVEYDYDLNGSRTAVRTFNASNTSLYSEATQHDQRGRLTYKESAGGRIDYSYYSNNRLKDAVSSNRNGINVGYRYDEGNRLESVEDASSGTTRMTAYAYNPNGSLGTVTQPNAVVHTYGYDALNRLRALIVSQGSTFIHTYEYKLRPSGHRRQVIEGSRTVTYTHDGTYRLIGESITADSRGNNGEISYALDKVANRISRASQVGAVGSQLNQTFNDRDGLSGDTYTANGSTSTSQFAELALGGTDSYDFEERLITRTKPDGSTINISYDGDGHRTAKSVLDAVGQPVSSTTWLVDTNNLTGYAQVVEERVSQFANPAAKVTRTFTYGSDLISQTTSLNSQPATVSYFTYDGHGSTRELTNAVGAVTDRYDYDAFGVIVSRSGPTFNDYLYCGEQFDAELGLYYLRARYLNVNAGRFWTADTYEGRGTDPNSLHRYLYALGRPATYMDPSGNASVADLQNVMFVVGTLARVAVPNVVRFGIKLTHLTAARALRPLFATAGGLPLVVKLGQRLSPWDKFQRFFVTPTRSYPGVATWIKDLFQLGGMKAQQGHIFIQQSWFRVGSPNQWYPDDFLAHQGLQRLGNAGFNLMAIPSGLNRALGAQSAKGASGTVAFASATAGGLAFAMDYIWELLTSGWDLPEQEPKPKLPI